MLCLVAGLEPAYPQPQTGIWTSAAELADLPLCGRAWQATLDAARAASPYTATVSDQGSNNNAEILAAGIVYARLGEEHYRDKVVQAIERLVEAGKPRGRTLAWGRETAAYVMAADLVGYRTAEFEAWLANMAEVWEADDGRTLMETFQTRANNWGSMAFGSLCAIYSYLKDTNKLADLRAYWIAAVEGRRIRLKYGADKSWHPEPRRPQLINGVGATINGIDVDGVIADDMRRGGAFRVPPRHTEYPWEHLQGTVTAARILARAGMPIWEVAGSAILRAAVLLEVNYARTYGPKWKAAGDDLWLLPFIDAAYGTALSVGATEEPRLWKHGKIAGWPVVTLAAPRAEDTSLQYGGPITKSQHICAGQ
jgi:hypothetical protein